jgi:hypothetical protein
MLLGMLDPADLDVQTVVDGHQVGVFIFFLDDFAKMYRIHF